VELLFSVVLALAAKAVGIEFLAKEFILPEDHLMVVRIRLNTCPYSGGRVSSSSPSEYTLPASTSLLGPVPRVDCNAPSNRGEDAKPELGSWPVLEW
jgi:hypothetical protein